MHIALSLVAGIVRSILFNGSGFKIKFEGLSDYKLLAQSFEFTVHGDLAAGS